MSPLPSSSLLPSSATLPELAPAYEPPSWKIFDHLAVQITRGDGATFRWGGDEPDARNTPLSISYGTSVPGGFTSANITLEREIDRDWPDLGLYDDVRIYGPGNETAYEGYVSQLPRSDGDEESIQVGCVGYSASLRHDPTFHEVYVDRDVNSWVEPTLNRRLAIAVDSRPLNSNFSASINQSITFNGSKTAFADGEVSELMYLMPPGCAAAAFQYKVEQGGTLTNIEDETLFASDSDNMSSADTDALVADDTLRSATVSPARRYLMLRMLATVASTPAVPPRYTYKKVAVYGNHGLALQDNGSDCDGVLASDVIEDVIARAAPLLSTDIEATSFVIPHLAFRENTTAEEVISRVNGFHLYEWGVYEDRRFFYRAPNPDRLTWNARRSDGATIDLEGASGDAVYNGVVVSYTDVNGTPKTVGPVGYGCDSENDDLLDSDATNPVNSHGIGKRPFPLELSEIQSLEGATRLGIAWLEENQRPQRRGTLVLSGQAEHPTRGLRPAWAVRAGDYIRVADHSGDVARRIIETNYSHDERTITLTLDNTAPRLEAIIERVAARLGRTQ